MAINFITYDELFAHDYQQIYISSRGYINVGTYTYNVFKAYTARERQQAFQACKKQLPWENSEVQEQWELCMYMYQWIIKSPPPFPYQEYTLSGEIMMADYHLLQQDIEKKTIRLVYHIPILAGGANQAGILWRDAIVMDQGGADNINTALPVIDASELADMKIGALIEVQETFRFSSINLTPLQKKTEIEARYSILSNGTPESILGQKQITLEWIGYENNVV